MLPYILSFISLALGYLSFKNHHKWYEKLKNNVDFYSVLSPIIWNKAGLRANKTSLIYFSLIWLGIIMSKVDLFLAREVTNAFTSQSKKSIVTVPWALIIFTALFKILKNSVDVAKKKKSVKVQESLVNKLQTKTFSKIHAMSVRWNVETGQGQIEALIKGGSNALWGVVSTYLASLLPACLSVFFSFLYISTHYSALAAITVIFISVILVFPKQLFDQWCRKFRDKERTSEQNMINRSMESLVYFQTVKNFACEDYERERFRKLKQNVIDAGYEKRWWTDLFGWVMNSLTTSLSLGIRLYGAYLLGDGQLTYGEYVLLTSLFLDLYYSCNSIYKQILSIPVTCEALNRTVALLRETPEITDKMNAPDIEITEGRIEFKNVTFSYALDKDSANPALVDISFVVEPGQILALVGGSGSGKSTVARLLTRMYDIDEGKILIDHQDVREVTMKSLRKAIGTVPQEVELFNETIIENIKYGRPDATKEEVIEAATKADVHKIIMELDDKYETKVGNKGMKLSGGQRQRLGIARVFLKDPQLVILDEATSALDTITERKIQDSLEVANRGKTSVVIAHRLSTICNADQIIVLDHGKMVEKGSHQELLELGGMYTQMWNQQTEKEFEPEEEEAEEEDNPVLLKTIIQALQDKVVWHKSVEKQRRLLQGSSWGKWLSAETTEAPGTPAMMTTSPPPTPELRRFLSSPADSRMC